MRWDIPFQFIAGQHELSQTKEAPQLRGDMPVEHIAGKIEQAKEKWDRADPIQ